MKSPRLIKYKGQLYEAINEADYQQKEKFSVSYNGKNYNVSRVWNGHRFTDTECEQLSKGQQITFPTVIKNNKRIFVTGKLEPQTYNGYNFLGFKPLSYSDNQPTKKISDIQDELVLTTGLPIKDTMRDIKSQLNQMVPSELYTVDYYIDERFNNDSDDDFAGVIKFKRDGKPLQLSRVLPFIVKNGVVDGFIGYTYNAKEAFENDVKYGKEYQYWVKQNAERQAEIDKKAFKRAEEQRAKRAELEQERIAKIPEMTLNVNGSTLKYKEIEREVTNRSRGGYRAKYLITYRDPDISDEDIEDAFMVDKGLYHYGRANVHDDYVSIVDYGGD